MYSDLEVYKQMESYYNRGPYFIINTPCYCFDIDKIQDCFSCQ